MPRGIRPPGAGFLPLPPFPGAGGGSRVPRRRGEDGGRADPGKGPARRGGVVGAAARATPRRPAASGHGAADGGEGASPAEPAAGGAAPAGAEAEAAAGEAAPASPTPRRRPPLLLLLALLPWGWFVVTGLHGIDFGVHWDEHRQWTSLQRMRDDGVLLPGNYWYGSVIHTLGVVAAMPEFADGWEQASTDGVPDTAFATHLRGDDFRFRWRSVFVLVSSLAVLWMALAGWLWRGSVVEGLFAACLVGFSWEFAYHARWPLADAVATQFAALCLLGLVVALRTGRGWGVTLAAVGAGLATGTKYPAGLLLLPVLLAALSRTPRWRSLLSAVVAFGLTYLVTTPGTLLEPGIFWRDVLFQMEHYATQGHATYTVEPGAEHARLLVTWLVGVLFSPWPPLAVAAVALAALGFVANLRGAAGAAAVVLVLPLVLVAYMSTNRVLIVRNDLMAAPFLALLGALGAGAVWRALARSTAGRVVALLVLLPLPLANAAWLGQAADSVARRADRERFLVELHEHLRAGAEHRFALSERVQAELRAAGLEPPPHADAGPGEADRFVFYASDLGGYWTLPASRFGSLDAVFGPAEVNYEYYPSWWGDDRLLVLTDVRVAELGLAPRLGGPPDPGVLFDQAWMLHQIGEVDGAIQGYRVLLSVAPAHRQGHFNLAHALMTQGRFGDAAEAFAACLRNAPDYNEAHRHLATCLDALGRTAEAERERALYAEGRAGAAASR